MNSCVPHDNANASHTNCSFLGENVRGYSQVGGGPAPSRKLRPGSLGKWHSYSQCFLPFPERGALQVSPARGQEATALRLISQGKEDDMHEAAGDVHEGLGFNRDEPRFITNKLSEVVAHHEPIAQVDLVNGSFAVTSTEYEMACGTTSDGEQFVVLMEVTSTAQGRNAMCLPTLQTPTLTASDETCAEIHARRHDVNSATQAGPSPRHPLNPFPTPAPDSPSPLCHRPVALQPAHTSPWASSGHAGGRRVGEGFCVPSRRERLRTATSSWRCTTWRAWRHRRAATRPRAPSSSSTSTARGSPMLTGEPCPHRCRRGFADIVRGRAALQAPPRTILFTWR